MLVTTTQQGLYCPAGDFYIDPLAPVHKAVITHAHSDHARAGSGSYLTAAPGERLLRMRVGAPSQIQTLPYGKTIDRQGVKISLHPAGHILGSAQVRLEYQGEVCVISGDYKVDPDPTCAPFEAVPCHTFITEATFGLPIYRWPPQQETFGQINSWWRQNQRQGKASVLFAYAVGKAQRILAGVDSSIGPIYVHGALVGFNRAYLESGVALPDAIYTGQVDARTDWSQALILAPPSAHATPWMNRFSPYSTAFASGWMCVRGQRRRRNIDRGFAISDHADWPGLMNAITSTGAEHVLVTHGYVAPVVRWLRESGWNAEPLETGFAHDEENGQ